MEDFVASESRYADAHEASLARIREARERRRGRHDEYESPPYENFYMDDPMPKKGSLVRVVVTQAVVCAVLLGGLFTAQKALPNTYKQLHASYTRVMQTDMSVKEVWAAAKAVFASLREDIYVLAPYREKTEPSTVPPATAPAKTAPAGGIPSAGGIDVALKYASLNCSAAPVALTVPPVLPVTQGEATSLFGYRIHPISGEEGVHTGLDIAAQEGAPIAAAFYGTVLETGESEGYGKYVLMEHGKGMVTFYAHCSELAAEEGMVLRPGETIAYVGSTGKSTGPHLHFELRLHGLRRDPAPLFGRDMYPVRDA